MNVYDTSNATNQAFIAAGLDFIDSLQAIIMNPLPIYKYYHTKAYKRFIQTTTLMRKLGELFFNMKCINIVCVHVDEINIVML